jgi:hypothetical protein
VPARAGAEIGDDLVAAHRDVAEHRDGLETGEQRAAGEGVGVLAAVEQVEPALGVTAVDPGLRDEAGNADDVLGEGELLIAQGLNGQRGDVGDVEGVNEVFPSVVGCAPFGIQPRRLPLHAPCAALAGGHAGGRRCA